MKDCCPWKRDNRYGVEGDMMTDLKTAAVLSGNGPGQKASDRSSYG